MPTPAGPYDLAGSRPKYPVRQTTGVPIVQPAKADWSPAIETGLPEIDAQHRRLFELAATFRGEGDQIRVMKSLAMLSDYANTHLRDEEAMLRAIDYPGLDAHCEQHRLFRAMLKALLDEARTLSLDQIAGRIADLINGWFYHHILTVDAEYVPAVKAQRGATGIVG
jgi:hemerythrin